MFNSRIMSRKFEYTAYGNGAVLRLEIVWSSKVAPLYLLIAVNYNLGDEIRHRTIKTA